MNPEYKERRSQALAALVAALEADDDDDYCEAYDQLVGTERDAGEFDEYQPGICRVCGCTDMFGCPEGCSWVDEEHTLCSSCVYKVKEALGLGNNLAITTADGQHVATASLGITCAVYFDELARKYDPAFNMFGPTATINQRLEPIYKAAAKHDYVVMLLFMNDKTTYGPEDIPHLERAVADYPPTFHEGPLRVITKFLDLLRQHQTLTVQYMNTDAALAVTTAPAGEAAGG